MVTSAGTSTLADTGVEDSGVIVPPDQRTARTTPTRLPGTPVRNPSGLDAQPQQRHEVFVLRQDITSTGQSA
nr:hypothetical protein [Kibdelosporangium sp. MJ126-NF4]